MSHQQLNHTHGDENPRRDTSSWAWVLLAVVVVLFAGYVIWNWQHMQPFQNNAPRTGAVAAVDPTATPTLTATRGPATATPKSATATPTRVAATATVDTTEDDLRAVFASAVADAVSTIQASEVSLATQPAPASPIATPVATTAAMADSAPQAAANAPQLAVVGSSTSNGWTKIYLAGADLDRGDGTTYRSVSFDLRELAPDLWRTFPNEPNPLVSEFRVVDGQQVPDGLEYANPESNFCQQLAGEQCRVPIAARHYFYYSGDYDIPGIGSCSGSVDGMGCMLIIVNVGDVTMDITGWFGQGFRLHARYWNGDALDMALWGLSSHGANVMTNMTSDLNPAFLITNAGANCSVPTGCEGVDVLIHITSGNEGLVQYETSFSR